MDNLQSWQAAEMLRSAEDKRHRERQQTELMKASGLPLYGYAISRILDASGNEKQDLVVNFTDLGFVATVNARTEASEFFSQLVKTKCISKYERIDNSRFQITGINHRLLEKKLQHYQSQLNPTTKREFIFQLITAITAIGMLILGVMQYARDQQIQKLNERIFDLENVTQYTQTLQEK